MLNNGAIQKREFRAIQSIILVNSMPTMRVSCRVDAAAVNYTDENGNEYVLAGTPLNGNLQDRQTPMTLATAGVPTGVLINDVPIINGQAANGSLLIEGTIIEEHIDPSIVTLIEATDIVTGDGTQNIKMINKK